jgi:hypothetical protein
MDFHGDRATMEVGDTVVGGVQATWNNDITNTKTTVTWLASSFGLQRVSMQHYLDCATYHGGTNVSPQKDVNACECLGCDMASPL